MKFLKIILVIMFFSGCINYEEIKENNRIGNFVSEMDISSNQNNSNHKVGDVVYLGAYPYENIAKSNPIEWILLETYSDGSGLLISRYGLDTLTFADSDKQASWENSHIRKWLNDSFYNKAFTSEEKEGISPMLLQNQLLKAGHSKKEEYYLKKQADTKDYVYLLSVDEILRLFPVADNRRIIPTPYALNKGVTVTNNYSPWWTRTSGEFFSFMGHYNMYVPIVDIDGNVLKIGRNSDTKGLLIRPVIKYNLALLKKKSEEDFLEQSDSQKNNKRVVVQKKGNSLNQISNNSNVIKDGLANVRIPIARRKNLNGIAVIIGIKNYENNVPAVEYALNDAASVKNFVIKTLGYSADNVIYVEDPTKGKMEEIFGNEKDYKAMLYDFVKPGQSDVFIYYAGHGAPDQENRTAYFVPKEANPDYIKHSGYAMATLYGNLAKLPARKITVVTDACFSGQTGTGKMIIKGASPLAVSAKIPVAAAGRGNGKMNVFNASRDTEMASWYTQKGHGMFTFYFLLGLSGAADKDGDKTITAGEMDEYLQQTVPYCARRMYHRSQTPMFIGNKDDVIAAYR